MHTDSYDKADLKSQRSHWLQIIVLAFVSLTIAFHLGMAAKGMSLHRSQHLGTALEYAKGRIDLLRPVIVGFTAGGTPIAQEVPFWQASAALLFKCFGTWFGWANLTSLIFMIAGLWPLFQLAKLAMGSHGAWWTLVFFTAQPLIVLESGRAGTDGSCLTFMLWFLFFAEELVRSGQFKWFIPAVFFGALSATAKAPFFLCAGLASFFLLFFQFRKSLRRWVLLSAVGLLVVIIFAGWTHYTDSLVAQAEFPFVDLRVSGSDTKGMSVVWWYFGNLAYRLSPAVWIKAGWRFLNVEFGSFALVGLAGAGFLFLRSGLIRYWLWASVVTVLIFTHLILNHDNYYLIVSPIVSISCAAAICQLENRLKENWPKALPWFFPGMAVLLLLAAIQGLIGMKIVLGMDPYPRHVAQLIQERTTPSDKLLLSGGDWGGQELFMSNRKGLTLWDTEIVEDPKKLNRLRELGYTKLVMISSSPLLAALESINPGGANIQRSSYRKGLTPTAERWPTLFENEDIPIKEIPAP